MTWFKVDDSFHGHPKLAQLDQGRAFGEAIALWTLAGSWCAHHLTDGFIPAAQLRKLVPFQTARAAVELVRVGLWIKTEGGFQFKDWTDYQPTKARVEAERAASAGRLAKWREKNAKRNVDETALQTPSDRMPLQTIAPTRPVIEEEGSARAKVTVVESDPTDPQVIRLPTTKQPESGAFDRAYVRKAFSNYWFERFGKRPDADFQSEPHKLLASLDRAVLWAQNENPSDPKRAIRAEAEAFITVNHEKLEAREIAWPLSYWLSRIGTWVDEACRTEVASV